jgi:hypothetical protein
MPGETREVTATYDAKDLAGKAPQVEVGGWNVTGASEMKP